MTGSDIILTVQQVSDYLEVPVATLYAWRHRRVGPPSFRIGRHLRYRRSDLEHWIEGRIADDVRTGSIHGVGDKEQAGESIDD